MLALQIRKVVESDLGCGERDESATDQEKRTEAPLPERSLSLNRMLDLERPVKKDDLTGKPRAAG